MVKFLIVRHGFSLSNKDGTFTGQLDIGLSKVGKLQAKAVSNYLLENYKIDAVYSSDLSRAVDTVKGVADALGLSVVTDARLREYYCGKWEGLTVAQVEELYLDDLNKWRTDNGGDVGPTDGETRDQIRDRSVAALKEIAEKNQGKTVVVATHGGTIKAMQEVWKDPLNLLNESWATNASTSVVEFDGTDFIVSLNGYDEYLGRDKTEMPKGI
ncbi:MAG: histidine phosphatase family protein [Clostridiales bacterium]|nr:histidine phosphatase family protein [Clostridiales bacterium]